MTNTSSGHNLGACLVVDENVEIYYVCSMSTCAEAEARNYAEDLKRPVGVDKLGGFAADLWYRWG